ncbi:MAG: Gfo/Idh/MocA family oxidoreductase [Caldilineaceae bacterium]|nr:Gfo/Idh/MocA family oxidoreductase [Caldilineaceae bacterium]
MTKPLRALILGSGYAGKGHTEALRSAGVEVVGMAARTPDVVRQVAAELSIPHADIDWRQALAELQPDIVAVGTPGGAHFEPVMAALAQRCHIFCDKPLAATAEEARQIWRKAREMNVKTAYAASYRYQPCALFARELIADGAIGEPWEVECISHYNLNPLIPFGWSHRVELGGGRLNNNFTHKLSIVLHILDGTIVAVNGEARNDMPAAPVVEGIHDFREREAFAPDSTDVGDIEWREANSEWSYTVLARMETKKALRQPVSALFRHGGLHPRFHEDSMAFYGSEGAIHIQGSYAQGPFYLRQRGQDAWEERPVPAANLAGLPDIEDNTQRNWTQLARAFVADIRGEGDSGYQTARDGWIFQEVIEAIRNGQGWTVVPQELA